MFGLTRPVHVRFRPGTGGSQSKPQGPARVRSATGAGRPGLADDAIVALYCTDGPPGELHRQGESRLHGAVAWELFLSNTRSSDGLSVTEGARGTSMEEPAIAPFPLVTTHTGQGRVIIRMAIVLGSAAALFFIFTRWGSTIQHRAYVRVEHVCWVAYAALSISVDLGIRNAARMNSGHYPFSSACAVVFVEALKLGASALLFAGSAWSQLKEGRKPLLPSARDIAWLALAGFVYTCNNLIVYQAIGHVPLGALGVIRETVLIWSAVFWTLVFQVHIGLIRWFSIYLLFVGCVVNQLPGFIHAEFNWTILWALLLAFSNAAGSVANEFAMKRNAAIDINLQNCILYVSCSGFGMIYLVAFQTDDLRKGFFYGFNSQCIEVVILQMLAGLAVSRILKYMDSVTKTIVAALRGPGVIIFGAWFFHFMLHATEIVATLVACFACILYLREGPLAKPVDRSTAQGTKARS